MALPMTKAALTRATEVFERRMCFRTCRPNLGAKAFAAGWYFDFNWAYVGAGFITPISVSIFVPSNGTD